MLWAKQVSLHYTRCTRYSFVHIGYASNITSIVHDWCLKFQSRDSQNTITDNYSLRFKRCACKCVWSASRDATLRCSPTSLRLASPRLTRIQINARGDWGCSVDPSRSELSAAVCLMEEKVSTGRLRRVVWWCSGLQMALVTSGSPRRRYCIKTFSGPTAQAGLHGVMSNT